MSSSNTAVILDIMTQLGPIEDDAQYAQAAAWYREYEDDESPEAERLKKELIYYMDEYDAERR